MVKKRTLIGLAMLVSTTGVAAQEEAAAPPPWTHQLVGNLTANQVSQKDWAQGGENALSWGLSVEGRSVREQTLTQWATSYKLGFGQTKLGDQETRKTLDRINLESILTYKLDKHVNPYVGATLKTQFLKGYTYAAAGRIAVTQFMDPAYLTQSFGAGFAPRPEIRTRFGLALREILTSEYNAYADDAATAKIEKTRVDGGLESVTSGEWQLAENILATSKLEIFAPFTALDETAVRSDNSLAVKLINYVNLNVNLELVDDATASDELQIRQAMALGLSYTFL